MKNHFALLSVVLLCMPILARSAELVIPRGTVVFGELEERITSNGRKFRVGYPVDAHVWKDVVVDGHTVVTAGTPMVLRISKLSGSNVGGRGGSLEIMAVSVQATDGTEITLSGGYDQSGGNRYGLTRALSFLLWPAGFLPGRNAVLDVGTVFDAAIPADTRITIPDDAVPTLKLGSLPDLSVEVLYDEFGQREGTLPLALTLCNRGFTREASVTAVNEHAVRPILVAIISSDRGEPCHEFRGRVNLESLQKELTPGINRFSVSMGGAEADVVLNVEM
ncbi:MAG: hypothetical protein JXB36_18135 [Gammaproteobacteria bacterium]|nr:hypothetical protein [Gammaproteobacteria bacterium]